MRVARAAKCDKQSSLERIGKQPSPMDRTSAMQPHCQTPHSMQKWQGSQAKLEMTSFSILGLNPCARGTLML